jgi:DNA processing protein
MNVPAISPYCEMGAYEALWSQKQASFKTIAEKVSQPGAERLSAHVLDSVSTEFARLALDVIQKAGIKRFGVRVRGSVEFPAGLNDAAHPLALLYFRGWWEHLLCTSIAVVGTRKPSDRAITTTRNLVSELIRDHEVTIVSGLADGIDTVAHESALKAKGKTVAVLGTPIHEPFPTKNRQLLEELAQNHLVVSQVPIYRWVTSPFPSRRFFFPERNVTMSALTKATVIIEAGETSGTLIQAKAALAQGRKLFLMDDCFQNASLAWPARFLGLGAIRVSSAAEIMEHIAHAP